MADCDLEKSFIFNITVEVTRYECFCDLSYHHRRYDWVQKSNGSYGDAILSPQGSVILVLQYYLWPPCVADEDIIFLPCGFYLLLFSSPNLSGRRVDVDHTSTHGVALV